jgi:hypothetical protein
MSSNYFGTSEEALRVLHSIHVRDRIILKLEHALKSIVDDSDVNLTWGQRNEAVLALKELKEARGE